MQTTIGIIICLIVIVIFSIGYMNSYEGLETGTTATTATTATTTSGRTISSPTGDVPLSTVVENSAKAMTAKETIVGLSQNKDQYAELINNLLDYYDNRSIIEIANAKPDKNGEYNLSRIVEYKMIKDALVQSLEFVS